MDPHPLDLQETMASNPRLFRALQDPTFVGALHIIQNDPTKAKAIFNENPQLASLFQEFGRVLGLHYSKLGKVQQQQQEAKPPEEQLKQVSTKNTRDPDQETVHKILSNQELAELLMDPSMQRVMQECGVPGRMQAYMQHPEYGPKLRKLINAGLLKVA
jgi:CHASE2 domain-containing sensor protein